MIIIVNQIVIAYYRSWSDFAAYILYTIVGMRPTAKRRVNKD